MGTEKYMAPEIYLNQDGYQGDKSDIFAAGVCLFAMLTKMMPFNAAKPSDKLYRCIAAKRFDVFFNFHLKHQNDKSVFSDDFKDLLAKMLAVDPEDRLSIEEIEMHPWYTGETLSEE